MGEAVNDRKESSAFSSTDADGLWCAIGVGRCTIDGVGEMRSERLSRDGLASANTSSSRNAAVLRKRKEKARRPRRKRGQGMMSYVMMACVVWTMMAWRHGMALEWKFEIRPGCNLNY